MRPAGQHDSMRRAAAQHGYTLFELSPWNIRLHEDAETRLQLDNALHASDSLIFTSPNAVYAAQALIDLASVAGKHWYAVGEQTRQTLLQQGVLHVSSPLQMDSEGLLELPGLADCDRRKFGLITAPGGRNRIAPVLMERGASVQRIHVYTREPLSPDPTVLEALSRLHADSWIALSSQEALSLLLPSLDDTLAAKFTNFRVCAASERLAQHASTVGFDRIHVAQSALPTDLMQTIVEHPIVSA